MGQREGQAVIQAPLPHLQHHIHVLAHGEGGQQH